MSAYERAPYCAVRHGERRCKHRADGVLSLGEMAANACRADGEQIARARGGRFTEIPRWIAMNAVAAR